MLKVLPSVLTSASPAAQPDPLTVTTSIVGAGCTSAAAVAGTSIDSATSAAAVFSMGSLSRVRARWRRQHQTLAACRVTKLHPLPDVFLTIHGRNENSCSVPAFTTTHVDSGTSSH